MGRKTHKLNRKPNVKPVKRTKGSAKLALSIKAYGGKLDGYGDSLKLYNESKNEAFRNIIGDDWVDNPQSKDYLANMGNSSLHYQGKANVDLQGTPIKGFNKPMLYRDTRGNSHIRYARPNAKPTSRKAIIDINKIDRLSLKRDNVIVAPIVRNINNINTSTKNTGRLSKNPKGGNYNTVFSKGQDYNYNVKSDGEVMSLSKEEFEALMNSGQYDNKGILKNNTNTDTMKRKPNIKKDFGGFINGAVSGGSAGAVAGPWGIAAGAVIGGALGYASSESNNAATAEAKKAEEEALKLQQENILAQNKRTDEISLSNYSQYGNEATAYYADGGTLNGTNINNSVNNISSTNKLARGNTHAQGGIEYGGNEIENKEVITKLPNGQEVVFSEKLGFANPANKIAKDIKSGEDSYAKLNSPEVANMLTRLKSKQHRLYNKQEELKAVTGQGAEPITEGQVGGGNSNITSPRPPIAVPSQDGSKLVGGGFVDGDEEAVINGISLNRRPNAIGYDSSSLPKTLTAPDYSKNSSFADGTGWDNFKGAFVNADWNKIGNYGLAAADIALPIVNYYQNKKALDSTPKTLPNVIPLTASKINTKYNINPQLNAIDSAVDSSIAYTSRNTSSSNAANANAIATKLAGAKAKNPLYGQKANVESQLENQQIAMTDANNRYNTTSQNIRNRGNVDYMNERAFAYNDLNNALMSSGSQALTNLKLGNYQNTEMKLIAEQFGLNSAEDIKNIDAIKLQSIRNLGFDIRNGQLVKTGQ